jgi:hypothetical protein
MFTNVLGFFESARIQNRVIEAATSEKKELKKGDNRARADKVSIRIHYNHTKIPPFLVFLSFPSIKRS